MKFEEFKYGLPTKNFIIKKGNFLIEKLKNASSFEEANKAFKSFEKYKSKIYTLFTNVSVHFTLDVRNETYVKNNDKMNELSPICAEINTRFNEILVKSKFRKELEEKYGSYLFKMLELSLKTFKPEIMEDIVKEGNLVNEYTKTMSSLTIEYKGKKYSLSMAGKFLESLDREERKTVGKAIHEKVLEVKDKVEDIYDQLVILRDGMAKKLGFKNYVELGYANMGRTDYTSKEVALYRQQILESVTPLCKKLERARRKRIGISSPYFYDNAITYKDGNPKVKGEEKVLVAEAEKMYKKLSKDTGEFFVFLQENHLLDLTAREGKSGGGYMTYFPDYQCPFIFSNFNGTSGDVDVLTHEFGHAFQAYCSKKIKPSAYQSPTMESCEIHSMSMEFLAYPYMDAFFDNSKKYRFAHLTDAIMFLPYGVAVDEFQHFVYENPNCGVKARDEKWLEIQKKYQPYLSNKGSELLESGARWIRQHHIFQSPFYYIDYTLAQVCAFQFFNWDVKNHEKTWKRYVKLCKLGGKYPFQELINKVHLKNPFVSGTVKKTIRPLVKYLKENTID